MGRAIEAVHADRVGNAFALVRPPGHHAERTAAKGFCLYNNVAIALAFRPDLVLVSAGFDIHFNDPLGKMKVTPAGFAGMTRILLDIAEQCCDGKLVMTLEGKSLPRSGARRAHLRLCLGNRLRFQARALVYPEAASRMVLPDLYFRTSANCQTRHRFGSVGALMAAVRDQRGSHMIAGIYSNWHASIRMHTKLGFRVQRRLSQCKRLNIFPAPPKAV